MTEPQLPRAADPLAEAGSLGAANDQSTFSELTADAVGAHADYGAGALIVCDRLVRIYTAEGIEVQALQGLDLVVETGELTALVGTSGSGKSTLVNILAALDTPTAGAVRVAGHDLASMSSRQRLAYRRSVIGFVWQQTARNLLPYLTAAQNAELPLRLAGAGRSARRKRAAELLDLLGVAHCAGRRPDQMSGGEQQRVSIGVALANSPSVLLADEPTGELDSDDGGVGLRRAADGQYRARRDRARRDARPGGIVDGPQNDRDQGRADRDRDAAARRRRQSGAWGTPIEYAVLDRAGRPAPTRDDRDPRHARPRPPRGGTGPHRDLAGPPRLPHHCPAWHFPQ